ncbi:MAG TPA: type IV pilus secretin PilQ [Thermodesulfobacteriota bacterium]|nr:type IV pilus secretin PilQ [Thermodesulfobacteriota bacterium]
MRFVKVRTELIKVKLRRMGSMKYSVKVISCSIVFLLVLCLSMAQAADKTVAGSAAVENIDFGAQNGVGLMTIKTSHPVKYEKLPGDNKFSLKLENVSLSQEMRVVRDVTDFDSPVNFISSLRDPADESDVMVLAELKESVPVEVEQEGDTIAVKFGKARKGGNLAEEEVEMVVEKEGRGPVWAFDFRTASLAGVGRTYRGQLVSFDFKDADIRDVLRILADISGFNIIISRDVKGSVTLKLANVPWDQALEVVLEDAGLGAVVEGNVIKIAPLKTLQTRQAAIQQAARSKEQAEPLVTRQVFVNYADAEELVPLADPVLSDRGELKVDVRTNSILVTDTATRVAQVEELVKSLDTITPQVLIESRIVQATLDFTRELGVQWGVRYQNDDVTIGGTRGAAPFGTLGNSFVVDLPAAVGTGSGGAVGIVATGLGGLDLDIRLSALENRGEGRILSSPKVLTLDNTPARIEQGVSIPFLSVSAAGTQTQFVDATLRLEVTPHVTNDNRILMDVRVTDNSPDPALTGADGQPAIRRNEAESRILAMDGDTIVIGGIFTRTATDNTNGIPWLSNIPLVGFMFKNTQNIDLRRELLVFITPRIVR